MVQAPASTPVTRPVARSTDAMEGLLEVQVPPVTVSVSVVVELTQTLLAPVIAVGSELTSMLREV